VSNTAAAVFDLDGLLVDSEVLWHEAEVEILAPLGAPIDASGTRATKGMFVAEVVAYWHERAGWIAPSVDDVVDQVLRRVGDLVEERGQILPGAIRALQLTAELGPVALASSTPTPLIERVLAHFSLRDAFDVVRSAQDEAYGKPNPAVFLSAARELGVAPPRCVVFEDAPAGVIAAKAARMSCVAVPAREERSAAAFGIADLVLDSLEDLDAEWLADRYGTVVR
jgi:mannitol-1-/sugar-/sorbitol-6-/2-deoxyglucose-6-phosphatase